MTELGKITKVLHKDSLNMINFFYLYGLKS